MKKFVALGVMTVLLGIASPAFAQYGGQSYITCTPATASSGAPVSCEAGFFQPGSTVTWTFNSTPINLGSTVADSNGIARINFAVPTGLELGAHTVVASGTSFSGVGQVALTVSTGITLGSAVGTTTSSSGGLPVTGSDTGLMTALAVGLVAGGALLVLATRRSSDKKDLIDV